MNAIETTGLTKRYGKRDVVDHLDLSIEEGSICGFLGKNGAGKTTTMKMLVGLSKPSCGRISLLGEERVYGKLDNSRIGYLPDVPNFYGYMTAQEYLTFCGKLYTVGDGLLQTRINELLSRVGLRDVKTRITGYSRGMKQRLGIAQALMNKPDILFMDEPISALDPIGRREIMALIRSLGGTVTVFFSTHILADVENTCDYAIMLEKGRVLESGSIAGLKQKYASNTALLRFYTSADASRFLTLLKKHTGLSVEEQCSTGFLLKADDIYALGKRIPCMLAEAGLSIESFQAYTPCLEDIFLEVAAHE